MPPEQTSTYPFVRIALLTAVTLLIIGCGKSERDRVDDLQALLAQKEYRSLMTSYEKLAPPLESSEQIARARVLYDTARSVVSQSIALILSADSLAEMGFAPEAYRKYSLAVSLEPAESTILIKRNSIPASGKPIYRFTGSLGKRDFSLTYHTKWVDNNLFPESVEIEVTNHHPTASVLLGEFVPVINYMEVDRSRMRLLQVYPFERGRFPNTVVKVLWRGDTKAASLSYTHAQVVKHDPALSYSDVFVRTMLGNDEACYISFLGYKHVKIPDFALVGYDN